MSAKTQAQLEAQLAQRWARVETSELSTTEAFGTVEDWIIQLGERKAFLHPNLKQWMWYDRLHDEWAFAGCGVGEGILLTIGKLGGVKKLPQPETVTGWCVYKQEQTLHGPLRVKELRSKLDSQQVPKDILVWSTRATTWLSVADVDGQEISFANDAGEPVLKVNDRGQLIEPAIKAKSIRRKKSL
ncbi:MAG: hypothetical protein Q8L87_15590 [Anaerolineales bacterium]|nr:hypothetical protein [Anaerolineales bacterium]